MARKDGVFIIAEAGVNHNGSLDMALKLVDAAAEAGADAVKFQTFRAETLVAQNAPKAEYQKATTDTRESQHDMLKRLELHGKAHQVLMDRSLERGIVFLSSPFDLTSIDLLSGLGLKIFKIPSGEITNYPYLLRIGQLQKQVILSTGMSEMPEIAEALEVLQTAGTAREQITVLHCTTEYPAPLEEVNLLAMRSIGETFGVQIGYSDHTPGIEIPVAAVALGARVIEKHFTLDRALPGPDHRASLEPSQLAAMVASIRNVEKALGDGVKRPTTSELVNRAVARKSLVAARAIARGEVFTEDNLAVKRPGTGLSPMRWPLLLGKQSRSDYPENAFIQDMEDSDDRKVE